MPTSPERSFCRLATLEYNPEVGAAELRNSSRYRSSDASSCSRSTAPKPYCVERRRAQLAATSSDTSFQVVSTMLTNNTSGTTGAATVAAPTTSSIAAAAALLHRGVSQSTPADASGALPWAKRTRKTSSVTFPHADGDPARSEPPPVGQVAATPQSAASVPQSNACSATANCHSVSAACSPSEASSSSSACSSSSSSLQDTCPMGCPGSAAAPETAGKPYIYVAPINSPFYEKVISPACDILLARNVVPAWITPNQISFTGLTCAVLATVAATMKFSLVAAILWFLYGILDNLDGKQARRTKMSSKSGEFVDHAIDSIVSSLSVVVILSLMVPRGVSPRLTGLLTLSGQVAFYIGCWAHHTLGRVLLGSQINGKDYFTVDELNIIVIPTMGTLRLMAPTVLDRPLMNFPTYGRKFLGMEHDSVTLGLLIVLSLMLFSIVGSIVVSCKIYHRQVQHLFWPGVVFAFLTIGFQPPLLMMIPCFSLLAFELIRERLVIVTALKSTRQRLWTPVAIYAIFALACFFLNVDVTWGLSNPSTATYCIVLCVGTLVLLIHYKESINQELTSLRSPATSSN